MTRLHRPAALLAALLLATGLLTTTPAASATTAPVVPPPADGGTRLPLVPDAAEPPAGPAGVSADGAWSWFGDPRAVRHTGRHDRTYVGWLSSAGEVQVAQHDHRTGELTTSTLVSDFEVDDHDNPSLLVRPDGRLMAFWSGHVGPAMHYRVSSEPESIASWGPVQTLPVQLPGMRGYTYPNPVYVPSERRLYLFWRGGSQPAVSWSDDLGQTWAPARQLVVVPQERPYVKVALAPDGSIGLAFTTAHPRETDVNDVHYAALRGGALHRSDGTLIGSLDDPPRGPAAFETVHAQAEWGDRAWIHDLAFDPTGAPVVVLAAFPSRSDHRYRYARRTAAGWQVREMVAAGPAFETSGREPFYSGGISLDHEDPSTVYLSRRVGATWEIERWRTPDGGATWTRRALTRGSDLPNVRPVSPRGSSGGALDVLWMAGGYVHYTSFSTGIAAADGLVEAEVGLTTPARAMHGTSSPTTVTLTTATGRPLAGRTVTLWHRSTDAEPFRQVGSALTGSTGRATLRLPARTGELQARFGGDDRHDDASSAVSAVLMTPVPTTLRSRASATTVPAGRTVRISARLVRRDDGRTVAHVPVQLFRRAAGEASFRPLAPGRTGRLGEVSWLVRPGTGVTYQVRSTATPAYTGAASPLHAVRVRRAG